MPTYFYKARDTRGQPVQGQIEATSADAVASQLFNSGVTPIEIQERAAGKKLNLSFAEFRRRVAGEEVSLDDLLLFCRQMYTLTRSGVPLVRGIVGLADTSRSPALANALRAVRAELESGRDLSTALSFHPAIFTPLMVSIVRVGENTGRLEQAFLQLSQYLEMDRDTRDRVKTAMRYPMIVLIAIGIAVAVVNMVVIPAFAKVFSSLHAQLPWQTRLLMAVSDFFVTWWPLMLLAIIAGVLAFRSWIKTEQGRYEWDRFKLRIPIVGDIVLRATLARFARSFAMAASSGVPLVQALTVVARAVDNEYVAERILSMRTGIERGDSLMRTAQATGMFTPLIIQMIAVGEETGAVDSMMAEVAGFYEREVDYDIKHLSSLIEPVLIVAVGLLVLILALGVFLPMWDLASAYKP